MGERRFAVIWWALVVGILAVLAGGVWNEYRQLRRQTDMVERLDKQHAEIVREHREILEHLRQIDRMHK